MSLNSCLVIKFRESALMVRGQSCLIVVKNVKNVKVITCTGVNGGGMHPPNILAGGMQCVSSPLAATNLCQSSQCRIQLSDMTEMADPLITLDHCFSCKCFLVKLTGTITSESGATTGSLLLQLTKWTIMISFYVLVCCTNSYWFIVFLMFKFVFCQLSVQTNMNEWMNDDDYDDNHVILEIFTTNTLSLRLWKTYLNMSVCTIS